VDDQSTDALESEAGRPLSGPSAAAALLYEDDLFERAVRRSSREVHLFAAQLDARARAEVLASVEQDRATFHAAFAEEQETAARFAVVRRRVLAMLASAVASAGAVLIFLPSVSPLDDGAPSTWAVAFITGASVGLTMRVRGRRRPLGHIDYLVARDARLTARGQRRTAEELYVRALERIALPEAFRRSESSRLREARARGSVEPESASPHATTPPSPPQRVDGHLVVPRLDPTHLVQNVRAGTQIDTEALAEARGLVEALSGASIGLAGPRGVGKSTVAQSLLDSVSTEHQFLTVAVTAPVRYEPRDFILTMFAASCDAVTGTPVSRTRGAEGWRWQGSVLAAVVGGVGIGVYVSHGSIGGTVHHMWGAGLCLLGLAVLTLSWLPRVRPDPYAPPRRTTNLDLREVHPRDVKDELLREIRFQLTFTGGYAGKLIAPAGELSASRSVGLAQKQESYPDVVARFRAYLEGAADAYGKVVIAIDELDKLPTDDAVRFLDDVKSLFAIDGCFFILSVSEDALNLFERRGVPARDAFDSSIDDIVEVRPFNLAQSERLIDSRTTAMPLELIAICHVLAGGLPRDVIRHGRRIALNSGNGQTAIDLGRTLIAADLHSKIKATRTAIQTLDADGAYGDLQLWLGVLDDVTLSSAGLAVAFCACPKWSEPERRRGRAAERAGLVRDLVLGAAGYAYIALTLAEVVTGVGMRSSRVRVLAEDLAQARQSLATSSGVSWTKCSDARKEFGVKALKRPRLGNR
jgi:Cdc6-like AAA superfamily ATPase